MCEIAHCLYLHIFVWERSIKTVHASSFKKKNTCTNTQLWWIILCLIYTFATLYIHLHVHQIPKHLSVICSTKYMCCFLYPFLYRLFYKIEWYTLNFCFVGRNCIFTEYYAFLGESI